MLRADDVVVEYRSKSAGPKLPTGRAGVSTEPERMAAERPALAGRGFSLAAPGLHGISLAIPKGAVFGILGPNGSGKTTLLRVLAGILQPAAGRVSLDGVDLRRIPRRAIARRMAVVPQETHLAFDYSVLEIALMGRYPHLGNFGLEGPGDVRVAQDALAATGTAHLEARSFSTLSGGEKQRVVIASALAQAAGIMLLDEPTSSLDLGYQMDIGALVRDLNRTRGVTMVIATHDLNFAAGVCDELALLCDGQVMASGPAESVLTREAIAALYRVEADVARHPATGRLMVMPIRKAS